MPLTEDDIARICAQVCQQMSNLQPPKVNKFVPFEPAKETFAVYIKCFENYCARNKLDDSTDKNKSERAKLLLDSISTETYNLLISLVAPDEVSSKSYDQIEAILTKHLDPPANVFLQQHKFMNTIQRNGEEIKDFVTRLKTQAILCEFYCPHAACKKSIAETFMNAQFIRGIHDSEIREKLIQLGTDAKVTVKFDTVVSHALSLEAAKDSNKQMSKASYKDQQQPSGSGSSNPANQSLSINAVSHRSRPRDRFNQFNQQNQQRSNTPFQRTQNRSQSRGRQQFREKSQSRQAFYRTIGVDGLCFHCGRNDHPTDKCRTNRNSLKCNLCNKVGHIDKVCINSLSKNKSFGNRREPNGNKQVAHIENFDRDAGCGFDDCFSVNSVLRLNSSVPDRKYYVVVRIGQRSQQFEVDSGSRDTLLPRYLYEELQLGCSLSPPDDGLKSYTHTPLKVYGVTQVNASYNNIYACVELYVVADSYVPILGRNWIRAFGIDLLALDREHSHISHETAEV